MQSSKRMQPIVNLAQMKEDDEARRMGMRLTDVNTGHDQLERLTAMRSDYLVTYQATGKSVSAGKLQEFRRFMNKLDKAIYQQQTSIQDAEQHFTEQKNQWAHAHAHARALQQVTERYRTEEMKVVEKQEQQELDEHARRVFARRMVM